MTRPYNSVVFRLDRCERATQYPGGSYRACTERRAAAAAAGGSGGGAVCLWTDQMDLLACTAV